MEPKGEDNTLSKSKGSRGVSSLTLMCTLKSTTKQSANVFNFLGKYEHPGFTEVNSLIKESIRLDKQGCIWGGGKSHTGAHSNLPLPHNSPVIFLGFLVAKPAFLSRLAMHKISFCSPSHIKAPSRYADRSSREQRKLTNPPRLFLLKLAPQPADCQFP